MIERKWSDPFKDPRTGDSGRRYKKPSLFTFPISIAFLESTIPTPCFLSLSNLIPSDHFLLPTSYLRSSSPIVFSDVTITSKFFYFYFLLYIFSPFSSKTHEFRRHLAGMFTLSLFNKQIFSFLFIFPEMTPEFMNVVGKSRYSYHKRTNLIYFSGETGWVKMTRAQIERVYLAYGLNADGFVLPWVGCLDWIAFESDELIVFYFYAELINHITTHYVVGAKPPLTFIEQRSRIGEISDTQTSSSSRSEMGPTFTDERRLAVSEQAGEPSSLQPCGSLRGEGTPSDSSDRSIDHFVLARRIPHAPAPEPQAGNENEEEVVEVMEDPVRIPVLDEWGDEDPDEIVIKSSRTLGLAPKPNVSEPQDFVEKETCAQIKLVKSFYTKYNIDPDEYKITYVDKQKVEISELIRSRERVAFYVGQFDLGLRLPLDPFICQFLVAHNAVPIQLVANTVRALTSFLVVCRHLGYEPTLGSFYYFFRFANTKSKSGNPV